MVKRKRGEGVQDELVMLSIPCLILDFRRNFLLNFHKKKEREREPKSGNSFRFACFIVVSRERVEIMECGYDTVSCYCPMYPMCSYSADLVNVRNKNHTLSYGKHFFFFFPPAKSMPRGGWNRWRGVRDFGTLNVLYSY